MINELLNEIEENSAVMLYFSGDSCSVCHALKPKIEKEFAKKLPKIKQIYINAEENRAVAAHFSIFTVPSILVFLGGKEFAREARHISVSELVKKVERPYNIMLS